MPNSGKALFSNGDLLPPFRSGEFWQLKSVINKNSTTVNFINFILVYKLSKAYDSLKSKKTTALIN
jgi:hypothetical protein